MHSVYCYRSDYKLGGTSCGLDYSYSGSDTDIAFYKHRCNCDLIIDCREQRSTDLQQFDYCKTSAIRAVIHFVCVHVDGTTEGG